MATMPSAMIHLRLLGSAELRKPDGNLDHSFLAGPKRLALLAFMILSHHRGFIRRDRLLPLLWPDQGQKSARNSLSNMLYHIRQSLGDDLLVNRGREELKLNFDSVWCDAIEFEKAIADRKPDLAIELYRGALLEGFHIPVVSSELEQWLDHERGRIRSGYIDTLESLAIRAEKNNKYKEAATWWEKRVSVDPFDTRVAKKLSMMLAVSGNYAEALRKAKAHAQFLEQELGLDADEVLNEISESLIELRKKSTHQGAQDSDRYSNSVAVLPFEVLGRHPEASDFANGLHHDLLTRLSGIAGLKVISRTSVLRYRNSDKSIADIAGELEVETVIEGAVQLSGGLIRLHIQLIDAKSDGHEAAETFDRNMNQGNIFEVQSELAGKIAANLEAYLTPGERKRLSEWTPTENMEAYRCYIMGRRELDQRTASSMRRSLDLFSRAIELDPDYALAWVGRADAITLLYDYGHETDEKILDRAGEAVEIAVKLDPKLAEAHASKGLLHSNRFEAPEAISELLIAVDLQANYAEAHNWLSWNYQLMGEGEKALICSKRAVELNPLSPEAVSNLAVTLLYNGNPEEALTEAQRAYDLQPGWATPTFYKALVHYHRGAFAEALSELENLEVPWAGVGPRATEALCLIALGNVTEAEKLLEQFRQNGELFAEGLIHTALGEKNKAIRCFLKISRWGDWPCLSIFYLYRKELDSVRTDPRYVDIIKMVKMSRGLTRS